MKIYPNNKLTSSATLTISTVRDGYSASNIYSNNLHPPVRTTADTCTILIDFTAATDFDYVIIGGHNFTADVDVTVQANATDSWGAPSVEETMTYLSGNMIYEFSTTQTYRYVRIVIDDTGNADGYCEIGKLAIGDTYEMMSVTPVFNIDTSVSSLRMKSASGQVYGELGTVLDSITVNAVATKAEKDAFNAIYEANQDIIPFFVSLYPDSVADYGLLHAGFTTKKIPLQHNEDRMYRGTVTFEEVR